MYRSREPRVRATKNKNPSMRIPEKHLLHLILHDSSCFRVSDFDVTLLEFHVALFLQPVRVVGVLAGVLRVGPGRLDVGGRGHRILAEITKATGWKSITSQAIETPR